VAAGVHRYTSTGALPWPVRGVSYSGWRICGGDLLAGGGEQLACAAYCLLGSGQLAEARQVLRLEQLIFELGQLCSLLGLGESTADS